MFLAVCILLVASSTEANIQHELKIGHRPLCPCNDGNSSLHTRVVGGQEAGIGTFPYASILLWCEDPNCRRRFLFCGASLISDSYVITAAHCIQNLTADEIAVAVGVYNVLKYSTHQIIRAKSIVEHPDYDSSTHDVDIALIELQRAVTWRPGLRVCVLPPRDLEIIPGTMVSVYGLGHLRHGGGEPTILQSVELPVIENDVCKRRFHNVTMGETILSKHMLCAGGEIGKDSCSGDSGGGLVVRLGNEYVLCGLVSFGIRCGEPHMYGVYTRVSNFIDWIMRETRSSDCKPCVYGEEYSSFGERNALYSDYDVMNMHSQ